MRTKIPLLNPLEFLSVVQLPDCQVRFSDICRGASAGPVTDVIRWTVRLGPAGLQPPFPV